MPHLRPYKVALNGYGCVLRALFERGAKAGFEIVALNDLADQASLEYLTRFDSTHGRFPGEVKVDGDCLHINGDCVKVMRSATPEGIDWAALGIDLVLECSGAYNTRADGQRFLDAGAPRVLFSQPMASEADVDATVVYGINQACLTGSERLVSNASCTTNCGVPLLRVLDQAFGIEYVQITTIHSAMNDQPVIDAYHHEDLRRTRSAFQSVIPVSTGLARGIERLLPELAGRIQAKAVRVPTVNVSCLDITLHTARDTSAAEVNRVLREAALEGPLKGLLAYTELPHASCDFNHKRVLIREDLNVPVKDGVVASDARILAALPTIKLALEKGAAVMVCSHLGRPTEGEFSAENSLKPVADYLSKALGRDVPLVADYLDGVEVKAGDLVLFENVRFNKGEKKNADELAQQYAALCDVFVMDAFGTAHRAEGSTHGVAKFAKVAAAGPLLAAELDALGKALKAPAKPMAAIVAGSKVSTKLDVLNSLSAVCDQLIVGGGIANTFLAAAGHPVGKSLYEPDLVDTAKAIAAKVSVPLPVDVVVAKEFAETAEATVKAIADVAADDMILDIGPQTAANFAELLKSSKTILWNGPVGVFEFDQFGNGTQVLAKAIADSAAFSIAGGGDTLAAIDKYGVSKDISYISTGGGAFLEFVEGKVLPAVAILEERAKA